MATKVMVSFPDEFLVEVDRIAQDEHRSRSELVREALRLYMGMRQGARRPKDPALRRAVILHDSLSRLAPGEGEDSAIDVRDLRETH